MVVLCPDPFRNNREWVWQHDHTVLCPHVHANQIAEFGYVTLITLYVIKSMHKLVLCCSDVAKRKIGVKKLLLKQMEVAEAFSSEWVSSISTALILLRRVSLRCRYGLNGEKYILHINSGQSDRSVPKIVSNCSENNKHSSSAFSFTISCKQHCICCLLMYCSSRCIVAAVFAHRWW